MKQGFRALPTHSVIHPSNSAEIAPVKISSFGWYGFDSYGLNERLDVSQCSAETKGRILRGYIDDKDFDITY